MNISIDYKKIDSTGEILELTVGVDNPFDVFSGFPFHRVKKKPMRLRYLDSMALTDSFGSTVEIDTLEGTSRSSVGNIIILGLHGNVYFNKREAFVTNHILLPLESECDCDENLTDFTVKIDDEEIDFKKEIISTFSPCEVPNNRPELYAVQVLKPFILKALWGNLVGDAGDYLIIKDINDYYRCPSDMFLKLYDVFWSN